MSDDDNTVYFMNKIVPRDDKAWVFAVNMVTKELLGVTKFAAERAEDVPFAYAHSRISKYMAGTPGDYTLPVHSYFILHLQTCCLAYFRKESSAHPCL